MQFWKDIGQELLERELRPMVAMTSSEGRVLTTNHAMRSLVGTHATDAHFEDWLSRDDHVVLREAMALASLGERRRVALRLTRVPGMHCVFELSMTGGRVGSALLAVMIDAVPHASHAPLAPVAGLTYEVMIDRHRQPGTLLRISGEARANRPGQTCYEALHARTRPCERCPITSELPSPVRLTSTNPFRAEIVCTSRPVSHSVTVTTMPIDEPTYHAMVQARVEALVTRARLTDRERRVLDHLLLGRAIEEVAAAENISPRTAKYHQQNLLRKLGAESRLDLLRLLS